MKRFVMIVFPLLLSIGTARAAYTDPGRAVVRAPLDAGSATDAVGARTTSASSTSASPSGGDQQITGKRLVLTDSPAEAKGSLFSLSHDPTITLGGGNGSADDPTQFGGSFRVRTATGDRFDSTYNLPTAGWRTIGAPGRNKGYRFTSKTGPIKRVMVIPGRQVRVMGEGASAPPRRSLDRGRPRLARDAVDARTTLMDACRTYDDRTIDDGMVYDSDSPFALPRLPARPPAGLTH